MGIPAKCFIALLNVVMISAADRNDGTQNNFYTGTQSQFGNGGSSFTTTGGSGQSNSVFQSNGQGSVIVNRVSGANGEAYDYISVSNPRIIIDGDYFTCGGLVCPSDTFKCVVTSEAKSNDINNMRTISECLDKSGAVLKSNEIIENNPYPNAQPPYSRHTKVSREGMIMSEDSNGFSQYSTGSGKTLTKEEQEILSRETRRMQTQLHEQQEKFQHQMNEFNKNLQTQMRNSFGEGFPFGLNSPFTNNFPFGNNNPFTNNFPFGNSFPFYNPPNNYYGYQNFDDNEDRDNQY